MSNGFLKHIKIANNAKLEDFVPLLWQERRVGWIRKDKIEIVCEEEVFLFRDTFVQLATGTEDYDSLTNALSLASENLRNKGEIKGWWKEKYPLALTFGESPIAAIERGACPYFGLRSWGVHMNGYVRRPDGLHLWVARRSMEKQNDPGKLDNMVAGGQPLGLGLKENMQKECMEEAGIPPELSQHLRPAGHISYCHQQPHGLKPDEIYIFDLELPENFKPKPVDGEVEYFELMPADKIKEIIRHSEDVKYNCNLVFIDFFIRNGLLNPDEEPNYAELCAGLHG